MRAVKNLANNKSYGTFETTLYSSDFVYFSVRTLCFTHCIVIKASYRARCKDVELIFLIKKPL